MTSPFPDAEVFTGFDEAHHALLCYCARAHVQKCLLEADFLSDEQIKYIHVDNTSRLDRMQLTAYADDGHIVRSFTLYNDDAKGLNAVQCFEQVYADLCPPFASDLAEVPQDGWMIAMDKIRSYDHQADRKATQRTIVLANLRDMLISGDADCFMFGTDLKVPVEDQSYGQEL